MAQIPQLTLGESRNMASHDTKKISPTILVSTNSSSGIWKMLLSRQLEALEGKACQEFINGIKKIKNLIQDIPDIEMLSERLYGLIGWKLQPVSGLVEHKEYFELLANKHFPVATFLRTNDELDYCPLPDMWHDIFGHIPLLFFSPYGDLIQYFSKNILIANENKKEQLSTFYWYTIESGICRENGTRKVYGATLLSSFEELKHAVSYKPNIVPFSLGKIVDYPVNVHDIQQTFFEIPSFDYLGEIKSGLEEFLKT